ncbi:MAG: rod-binding protein [bacterium]
MNVTKCCNNNIKMTETNKEDENLRRACQDFESIFISYMLKSMRKTIPKTDFIQDKTSYEIYTSMMDEEIASAVARGQGIGLASAIYRQLKEKKF